MKFSQSHFNPISYSKHPKALFKLYYLKYSSSSFYHSFFEATSTFNAQSLIFIRFLIYRCYWKPPSSLFNRLNMKYFNLSEMYQDLTLNSEIIDYCTVNMGLLLKYLIDYEI